MFAGSLACAFLLAQVTTALPNGAPRCAINPPIIAGGHEVNGANLNMGYAITATQGAGGTWNFQVTNSNGEAALQGILFYINSQSSPLTHYGTFTLSQGFRYQTAAACQTAMVTGAMEATITQADSTKKPLSGIQFEWTPDAAASTAQGLTVAVAFSSYVKGVNAGEEAPPFVTMKFPFDLQAGITGPGQLMTKPDAANAAAPAGGAVAGTAAGGGNQGKAAADKCANAGGGGTNVGVDNAANGGGNAEAGNGGNAGNGGEGAEGGAGGEGGEGGDD